MSSSIGSPPFAPIVGAGTRQYVLQANQGFSGSGIATISGDTQMSLIAHLPPPAALVNMPTAVYVAYLVDQKGKNGFAAGRLLPAGEGTFQFRFQSHVPLSFYTRIVVSIENPSYIQSYPQGPIVLKVKDDLRNRFSQGDFKGAFVWFGSTAKRAGGFIQEKAGGFWNNRFGKQADPQVPAAEVVAGTGLNTPEVVSEPALPAPVPAGIAFQPHAPELSQGSYAPSQAAPQGMSAAADAALDPAFMASRGGYAPPRNRAGYALPPADRAANTMSGTQPMGQRMTSSGFGPRSSSLGRGLQNMMGGQGMMGGRGMMANRRMMVDRPYQPPTPPNQP